ncbi:hypothetical protein HY604_00650 [Candidatus Peregrinibacteria bacterium]|nr:hypothetical protein [Candidatus Peregrinibacteria bacterium]
MADDQANSGGAFNPFEQKSLEQNQPQVPDASEQLGEIKQDVAKKRKRRRNRRKNVFGGGEASDAPAGNGGTDDFPDKPPADDEIDTSKLPPVKEETRHKEEMAKEEEKKIQKQESSTVKSLDGQEALDDYGEPINPFDAPPVGAHAPAIDTKALEDKPMDRRDDSVAFSPFEDAVSAEETKFSEEKVAETGGVEENVFVDQNSIDGNGEVVHEAEVVDREEEPKISVPESQSEVLQKTDLNQEVDEFKKDFWSILQEAGITKNHLIGFAVFFFVIIAVILFFVFGGMSLFKGDGVEKEDVSVIEPEQDKSSQAYGLITSYLVGLQQADILKTPINVEGAYIFADTSGIDTALIIGIGEKADKIRYQYYIGLLRELLNIYQTDVYALVDLALDRRLALNDYLKEMNQLIIDADYALIEINAIMGDLDFRFEKVTEDKNFFEAQYFATTEALLVESSYVNLMEYVRVTQDADKLRGFYNAYSFLRDMYNNALLRIKPRYKDTVLNSDAIVGGIRVFDVPSSDIKAIIRLEE